MPKYKNLIEEVALARPEVLLEYPGKEYVEKAADAVAPYTSRAHAAGMDDYGTGVPGAGYAGAAAAVAGGAALSYWLKRRSKKVGMAKAQAEIQQAKAKIGKMGPKQKEVLKKRAGAMGKATTKMETFYGPGAAEALIEALAYQYQEYQDLVETPVSEISKLVEETLFEAKSKGGKYGGIGGAAAGAAAGGSLAQAGGYNITDLGDVGEIGLFVGGSALAGAAVGYLAGKGAAWIAKAVKKGMSRDQATKTMARAKEKLKTDAQFAAKVRAKAKGKKK